MTNHLDSGDARSAVITSRSAAGKRAYLSGVGAEDSVAAAYDQCGYVLIETRWQGRAGEIDLIFMQGDRYVFAEVKKARTHDQAIASLRRPQMKRIHAAASEFLASAPNGQLSDVRFDLATVDGAGQVKIMESAFDHF